MGTGSDPRMAHVEVAQGRPRQRATVLLILLIVVSLLALLLAGALVLGSRIPATGANLASPTAGLVAGGSPTATEAASTSTTPTSAPTAEATPARTPRPTPMPTTKPTPTANVVSFTVPATADCGGYDLPVAVEISWVVSHATGVTISIDGGGVYASYSGTSGSDTFPFACAPSETQHTYEIRTTGGSGSAAHITKTVARIG
ncbi:MAG: hypothetical protein HY262_01665 [Chloroflexi bacterium]|nr:hypothetical protein [Chloroflexota bacterium]